MRKLWQWLLWVSGIILIGNFFILRAYGDTLRSTHLFIVRSTVFYPLALLNLIAGILLLALMIWEGTAKYRQPKTGKAENE